MINNNPLLPDFEQLDAAVKESSREPMHCVLCDKLTHGRGVWIPRGTPMGKPAGGKSRVAIYALCDDHKRTKKVMRKVEAKILADCCKW